MTNFCVASSQMSEINKLSIQILNMINLVSMLRKILNFIVTTTIIRLFFL